MIPVVERLVDVALADVQFGGLLAQLERFLELAQALRDLGHLLDRDRILGGSLAARR